MSRSVGRIVGAAVFAVAGFFTGGWGWAAGAAVLGGMYGDYVARQMDRVGDQGNEPQSQTVRSSKAPVRHILGRVSTGGVLTWAQEEAGDQDEGEWLHMVYTLSEGSIDGLEDVLINKERVGSVGQNIKMELVRDADTPNQFLLQNSPDWRTSMIGRGLSWMRVSLKFDPEVFPSGIPEVQFIVRGRTDIYDPRTGEYGYTDNVALCALWYLRNVCEVPDDEIVFDSFASAANVCDEEVENPDGTFSKRYTMGAVISDEEDRTAVLDKMMSACSGKLLRIGGRWMMQAGAYYGPEEFEITEDMVIGAVSGSVEVDNDSAINTVTGTFTDPSQAWTETDFPPLVNHDWLAEDGAELSESMQIRYVTDPYQAQRLASIRLRQRRNGGEISLPMNFNGYNCRPGRVVRLNLPSLNIDGEFIVTDWSMGAEQGCNVTLSAYDAEMFDDAVGEPYSPGGFISLPTGGMDAPTNLQFTLSSDPMVKQGTVTWSPPAQPVQYYGIVIRNSLGEAVQTYQVPPAASSCDIQGLVEGQYTVSVYARGESGRSGEVTMVFNLTAPAAPSDLGLTSSNNTVTSRPYLEGAGLGTQFEFAIAREGGGGGFEQTGWTRGDSVVFTGLIPDTTYLVFVRTVNPLGTSGVVSGTIKTTLNISEQVDVVREILEDSPIFDDVVDELRDRVEGVRDRITTTRETFIDNINDILDNAFETRDRVIADNIESQERKTGISQVNERVDTESEQRILQGEIITATLDNEVATRQAQITNVNQAIADEAGARATSVNQLNGRVDAVDSEVEAVSTFAQNVDARVDGTVTATNLLEARVVDVETGQSATATLLQNAGLQADGSTNATTAILNQINDPETGLQANADLILDVIQDPFGNSSALANLNTGVNNLEGDVAQANLTLESIYDATNDELIARGALTVDHNGRVSGMVVESGAGRSDIEMLAHRIAFVNPISARKDLVWDAEQSRLVLRGGIFADYGRIANWDIDNSSIYKMASGVKVAEFNSSVPQLIFRSATTGLPTAQLSSSTLRAGREGEGDYLIWSQGGGLRMSGTLRAGRFVTSAGDSGQRVDIYDDGNYLIWAGSGAKTDANATFYIKQNGVGYISGEFFQGGIIESKSATASVSGGNWRVTATGHRSQGKGVKIDFSVSITLDFTGDATGVESHLNATVRRNGSVVGSMQISPIPNAIYEQENNRTLVQYSGAGFVVDDRTVSENRDYQLSVTLSGGGGLGYTSSNGRISVTTFENMLSS